jgi:N-acyl-phosphatidylethanolamine-hydrolysing phospholipase D
MVVAACAAASEPLAGRPAHHTANGFVNVDQTYPRAGGWARARFMARRVAATIFTPREFSAPRVANDGAALRAGALAPSITWVGHATLLVQLDGLNILTDPHWSDRASPVGFAGPRRLSPPGLAFETLPRIDVVVISHDHYDHLDLPTVRRLARDHDPLFLVPLGMQAWFAAYVGARRVVELDWWQTHEVRGVTFHCTPAQHFAQRSPFDVGRRLWATWVIAGRERRLFFSGDTGYFGGFKEIRRRLGPVDVAAVAIGAYLPAEIMRAVHVTPEEAVQVADDLESAVLLGIHWGTFDLAEEPPGEPPVRMTAEAARRGRGAERAWILAIGETRRW